MDLKLYEGIQYQMLDNNQEEFIGCGFSTNKFQVEWDGKTDVLMQDDSLVVDIGTFSNADEYLTKAERFLNPIKHWLKNLFVKRAMNRRFNELRNYGSETLQTVDNEIKVTNVE